MAAGEIGLGRLHGSRQRVSEGETGDDGGGEKRKKEERTASGNLAFSSTEAVD